MSYLSDFLYWNSGNECPENYLIFSALTLGSDVIRRKVYIDWPPNRITTNLYTFLIGNQGSRKGVAKSARFNILIEHFPHIPRGASTTTPQAITKRMASADHTMAFKDEKDVLTEVHTISFSVGELKHFLGINQSGMLDMLTDAWDEKVLSADYKNSGEDMIPNPYIVLLACETPNWILERLKTELISGGFCRRVLWIYEEKKRCVIDEPFVTPEMEAAKMRCVAMLKSAEKKIGRVTFSPDAKAFYKQWYHKHEANPPTDPLMEGFHTSHHELVLKIASILTALEKPTLELDTETVQISIALLDRILPGMQKLFRGAGRNQLAQPTERLMDWLHAKGGSAPEKEFLLFAGRDMDPRESYSVMQNLAKTERILVADKTSTTPDGRTLTKRYVMTPEYYEKQKQGNPPPNK